MNNDLPCKELCEAFNLNQEDVQYVPSMKGQLSTDCPNCCFRDTKGGPGCMDYNYGRYCTAYDRRDKQAGYWVVKTQPKPLTLEEAEAKITELQQYAMELKNPALIAGEVYKHKPTGSLYLVVTDPDDGERRLLVCLKGDKGHTDNVYFCESFRAKADIEGKRSDFLRMCTIQDLL